MTEELIALRDQIAELDRALLELLDRRFKLAEQVGRLKAERGRPVVVREVEQRVLSRAREQAEVCGVSQGVMEEIFAAIIRGSVERQHRVGIDLRAVGGKRVLVVGAAGAMGGWLRRFLAGIGHRVDGVDTAWEGLPAEEGRFAALPGESDVAEYDGIVVTVPLERTPEVLNDLAALGVAAPVIEIASVKDHLRPALTRLAEGGTRVLSLHPMFGPGKNLYEPLTIVHAVVDDAEALMGWLLGLAHLTGMLFGDALTRSGLDPAELTRIASTTFSRQASTSMSVLTEDPALYFAIQRLNPHRGEVYAALTAALGELTGAVERGDRESFTEALRQAATALPPV